MHKVLSHPTPLAVLHNDLGYRLRLIDDEICTPEAKAKLEVNRPGRKVPHYPFVPSHHDPEPWGIPNYKTTMIHKKVGKRSGSKRGRK